MQYQVRQTIRCVDNRNDKGKESYQVSYLPARDREDATHLSTALTRATDQYWREGLCVYDRSYDVVIVMYSHNIISGSRKMILSIAEMEMIATEFTSPRSADDMAMAAE